MANTANTIDIVVRAVDQATRPLRDVSREVDALAARLRQIGGAMAELSAPGLPAFPPEVVARQVSMPRAGGAAQTALPAGETTVIHVMLPEAALREPGRAAALGEDFGAALARRLRERG